MSVHIDELHSEVAAAPSVPDRVGAKPADPPWVAEESWRDEQERAAWLARRVCAVDFDD